MTLKCIVHCDFYVDNVAHLIKGQVIDSPTAIILICEKTYRYKSSDSRAIIKDENGNPKAEIVEGVSVPITYNKTTYEKPDDATIRKYLAHYGYKYISHEFDDDNHETKVKVEAARQIFGNRKTFLFESKEDAFDMIEIVCLHHYHDDEGGYILSLLGTTKDDNLPYYELKYEEKECN